MPSVPQRATTNKYGDTPAARVMQEQDRIHDLLADLTVHVQHHPHPDPVTQYQFLLLLKKLDRRY